MSTKKRFVFLIVMGSLLFACTPPAQIQPTVTAPPTFIPATQTQIPTQMPPPELSPTASETVAPTSPGPSGSILQIKPGYPLIIPRTRHTATLLQNGKILLVGGSLEPDDFVADEELFDPRTGESSWTAPLHTPRHGHTATLLPDGRVLVVGGYSLPQQWLSDAEVYDPSSNTWTVNAPLYHHGSAHTATLMKDGRVLIVGGCIGSGVCTNQVEIFDPRTNTWLEAAPLASDRAIHAAQLLDDGRVLIIGGEEADGDVPLDGTAVLYNPQTNTWTSTAPMGTARFGAEVVKLPDGRVLAAGGVIPKMSPPMVVRSVEIYDPSSNTWSAAPDLALERYAFVLKAFPNGQVIAIGGTRDWDCCLSGSSFLYEIELYDPAASQWQTVANLPQPSAFATGILLNNNQVWIGGGQSGETGDTCLIDTWVVERSGD